MRVDACYHRMRIRVKLTCDEMCGSVGAGDRTRSEASSFRRVTVNAHRRATSRGYPTTAMTGSRHCSRQRWAPPSFIMAVRPNTARGDGRHSRLFFPADCISLAEECRAREGECV